MTHHPLRNSTGQTPALPLTSQHPTACQRETLSKTISTQTVPDCATHFWCQKAKLLGKFHTHTQESKLAKTPTCIPRKDSGQDTSHVPPNLSSQDFSPNPAVKKRVVADAQNTDITQRYRDKGKLNHKEARVGLGKAWKKRKDPRLHTRGKLPGCKEKGPRSRQQCSGSSARLLGGHQTALRLFGSTLGTLLVLGTLLPQGQASRHLRHSPPQPQRVVQDAI